jgi:hypothetical protein
MMRYAFPPGAMRALRRAAVAAVATVALCSVAGAQMILPGAVTAPAEGGAPAAAAGAPRPAKPKSLVPPPLAAPSPLALAGKTFALNGGRSIVSFSVLDKQVSVSRLSLAGSMISNSRADCQVQAEATPIAVTDLGRPRGVTQLQVGFPACPVVFDVLDGAVLAAPGQAACDFKAADCHVDPTGLWGPTAADFSPARDKEIERARGHADAEVRENYKALVAATKDRPTIMGYARDQAQFSSTREEICRDYAGEGQHGYCAMKLAEARAAELRGKLAAALVAKAARMAKRHPGQSKQK